MPCKTPGDKCVCRRCRDGWYSRRHKTRDAQDAARAAYQAQRGPAARRARAAA